MCVFLNFPGSNIYIYPLVIEHSRGKWPIEIDVFFPARNLHLWLEFSMAMLNNQMVYIHTDTYISKLLLVKLSFHRFS